MKQNHLILPYNFGQYRRTKRKSAPEIIILFYLVLFYSLLFPVSLYSQNYPTQQFTMTDGMPGMGIQSIYKDSRGLLWIGTDTGLCSFDEKTFRIYKPDEGMTASQVWTITEDNDGNLWFGSFGEGIFKFNGKRFKQFTTRDGLIEDRIRTMCWSEKYNCIVAAGYEGISVITADTIKVFPENKAEREKFTLATGTSDFGDYIYITTYGSDNPYRYFPGENKLISVSDSGKHFPVNSFSVFLSSKGDTVFSNGFDGISIFRKDQTVEVHKNMGQVFGITEDQQGNIWMASWSTVNRSMIEGVFRYDGKTIKNFKTAFGISDKEIWTVFYDREQDILWVGTMNEGLFRVPFSGITEYDPSFFALKENKINRVFADSKNRIWISGDRELLIMNPDQSFITFDKNSSFQTFKNFWTEKNQKLIHPDVRHRLAPADLDKNGRKKYLKETPFNFGDVIEVGKDSFIYINHLGTFLFNETDNKTKYLNLEGYDGELAAFNDTLIYSGAITSIHPGFQESKMEDYIAFDLMHSAFLNFNLNEDPRNVSRVRRFEGQTWYTSWNSGLWMSKGMHLVHFNESDSTISNSLNDICFDEKGHVIFGSNTGEICIASYTDSQLKINYRINSDNGLQGNSISWLVADQNGKLWTGTNRGLSCIDLNELYSKGEYNIRFIDEESGYLGQSSKNAVIDSAGNLWIGAGGQLIQFDTKTFLSDHFSSGQLVIRSLEINNLPVDSFINYRLNPWTSLPHGKFKLKHDENNLAFFIDVINYRNPEDDRFRYNLKGFHQSWSSWSENRKAVFTNLPPGNYTLSIEAYNLGMPVKTESLEYKFTIRRPWWGIWYVNFGLILFLLTAVVLITRRISERERVKRFRKAEIEKKIVQLEMQALQAQMNPHFIFNSINGIQSFVLANKMDEVLDYLSAFSTVVRGSLENVTKRMVPLEQELAFLQSYLKLEKMRFSDKFDFQIDCFEEDKNIIQIPPMLVQPFAENAIRHGFMKLESKGNLSIVFEKAEIDLIKCTVTDNGVGREKARLMNELPYEKERPHSGLITATRIHLFNSTEVPDKYKVVYTDRFENGKSCGLKVELFLPMEI